MPDQPSALDALLATLAPDRAANTASAHIDEGWMQGRTAYGGISSAVALAATKALYAPAAPLRYAQISFVGPVGGECRVGTRVLRQSKSSLFVEADVSSDAGFGTAAVFAFAPDRASHVDHDRLAMPEVPEVPEVPDPESLSPVPDHKARPAFTRHFDMRPTSGPRFSWKGDVGEYLTWVRFVEDLQCDPAVALLAMGDALPPAAMALFSQFGPISSMNWTVNMLTSTLHTEDGWWLLHALTRHTRAGYSVQDMMIWNRAGDAVVSGSQCIAVYC